LKFDDRVDILRRSFIFSSLNDEELSTLADLSTNKMFMPGEFIFWNVDPPDWFYIVTKGQVKVMKHSSSGKEFIITFFGYGEMFGEVAVFENKSYSALAQTVDEVKVIDIRRQDFLSFLTNQPARVALHIISILAGRLRDAQGRLRDFAGERVERRLTCILFMLSTKLGSILPFTRQEIADMAGTTVETAIRVMNNLRERGIIRAVHGKVIIQDEEKIRLLSEGPLQVQHSG